ncbi:hypothetical protein LEP1GSC067_0167 [Leptospira interrogans serovar Lora str. TE 1992]|uniref:Uncharacterized protein n=1 Tax=Leptospira interrogans serovar Lora str. TE 1992 TaxID=1193028 RepID=M3E132_LEPIR|nr:hypothetical protein LEP1GSC067_0167 [Leptospira interrogans serovar Lora str. TE 1992]
MIFRFFKILIQIVYPVSFTKKNERCNSDSFGRFISRWII